MRKEIAAESVGISSAKILEMLKLYDKEVPDWQGITILRHNKVIASGMKKPYDDETPRMLYSLSKSFSGMAVGLLFTDGLVKLEDKFVDYHKDKLPKGYDKRFDNLTIRDILRFNSNCVTVSTHFIGELGDWVKLYLSYTLPRDPGTGFEYDTGGSMALCSLVNATKGISAFELLNERIFMPLGIYDCHWLQSPQGYSAGGWGLYLGMESLVKIAKLWMNMGAWEGKQIISKEFMQAATSWQTETGVMGEGMGCAHYGYQFWLGDYTFNGMGAYGTMINCCPKEDMAIVILANSQGGTVKRSFELMNEYFFAPENPETLPEDKQAEKELDEYLSNISMPMPKGEKVNAEFEKAMFGRMIKLQENVRGLRGMHFERIAEDKIVLNLCFMDRNVPIKAGYKDFCDTYTARAGIRTCFDDEAVIHIRHSATYAIDGDTLYVYDQLLNTNNTDTYILKMDAGKLNGTVQVSTVLGGTTSPESLLEQ